MRYDIDLYNIGRYRDLYFWYFRYW